MPNPIPGGEGLVIGLKRFGADTAEGAAALANLLMMNPRGESPQVTRDAAELMGLMRQSVDEETVNYLAEDPSLLRLLPVAMGEVGPVAAGAIPGLARSVGKKGAKKVAQKLDNVVEFPIDEAGLRARQMLDNMTESADLYAELLRREDELSNALRRISKEGGGIEKKIIKRSNFPDEATRLSGLHSEKTDEFVATSQEYEKILDMIKRMEDTFGFAPNG